MAGGVSERGAEREIETARLLLRPFEERDLDAVYALLSDVEVNTFLPWYPVKDMGEAKAFSEKRLGPGPYCFAICLKGQDYPIGYVQVERESSYELGYALREEYWHQGIVSEACGAVMERLRQDGVPYITATHDVNNPRSGAVMERLGMRYCYSYKEQWQPKDFFVIFRMYRLDLRGPTVVIRQEETADHSGVYSLVKTAFARAAHTDGTEHELVNALRESEAYIPELSLVAEIDGQLIGHLMFTKARIGDATVLALAPLSVLPEYQRQGVGAALVQAGHRIARGLGYGWSVVLGSPTYYPRFGYLPADTYGIQSPFDVPRENYMAYKLSENAPTLHGVVRYASEFGIEEQ